MNRPITIMRAPNRWLAQENAREIANHEPTTPEQEAAEQHARQLRAAAKERRRSGLSSVVHSTHPWPGVGSGRAANVLDAQRLAMSRAFGVTPDEIEAVEEFRDGDPSLEGNRWARLIEDWCLRKIGIKR
jgi:hypothetical protein